MTRRSSRLTLADINPKCLEANRAVIEAALRPKTIGIAVAPEVGGEKPRIKQKQRKVSLLEERWGKELRVKHPGATIYEQFPLPIGNGSNYYVDYLIVRGGRGTDRPLEMFGDEVKGPYARSTGIVKLKAAATRFPWIKFSLVSEIKGRGWSVQEVLP